MIKYNWKIPNISAMPWKPLSDLGYTPLLSAVLKSRGIDTYKKAQEYLGCDSSKICDHLLLNDMEKAVARIELAIKNGEKVAVYGDYDVDGITSSCLVFDYLKYRGLEPCVYIPHRMEEGYGVNVHAIEKLKNQGISLIITVDCGITAFDEVSKAKELGVDVIITDHHECPPELPDAVAIINPKRRDSTYPNAMLAGVGVAFKLVCGLEGGLSFALENYSDLVAVGTIADVMPLIGENRVLVSLGLEKLRQNPREGIKALLEQSWGEDKPVTASTISFTLAPRINAAGRLCKTKTSVDLLLTKNKEMANVLSSELIALNRQRQELEAKVLDEAELYLEKNPPKGPIVIASDTWHPGVVGIAASRLGEKYSLPSIMICFDGDKGKGSCRSYGDFNLFDALSSCRETIMSFGGHSFAAGVNVQRDMLDEFRKAIFKYYEENPPKEKPSIEAELLIDEFELLSLENVSSLDQLEPCGANNPRPVMCIKNGVLTNVVAMSNGKHLRFKIEKNGLSINCVYFNQNMEQLELSPNDLVDLCFLPQINEFHGRKSVQLLSQGLRPSFELSLCRSILKGDGESFDDYKAFKPSRDDLGKIWRKLAKVQRAYTLELDRMFKKQNETNPVMLVLGLLIFKELGLVSLEIDGEFMKVKAENNAPKVDLTSSKLYNKLWEN